MHEQEDEVIKPKFNVSEPFEDTVVVQMNVEFVELLLSFLERSQAQLGKIPAEIWAMKRALADPRGCQLRRYQKQNSDFEHRR